MIDLQEVGCRLLIVFPPRVQNDVETEDFIAHGVEEVPWLRSTIMMNQVGLNRDQSLHDDVTNLLLQELNVEFVPLRGGLSLNSRPNRLKTSFMSLFPLVIGCEV